MTIHQTCEATSHAACICGASPGQPCDCRAGAYHLSRFARARAGGLISGPAFAGVISDADVFTGTTLVIDPEVTP